MPFKAENLHLMTETPAGKTWMYDAEYDHTIDRRYFDGAHEKLSAGDFIFVNSDGGGAPAGSILHVWVSDTREVAINPVARSFCECDGCMERRQES